MSTGYWDNDPDLVADWRYQVANGDTLRGFHEWAASEAERPVEDEGDA